MVNACPCCRPGDGVEPTDVRAQVRVAQDHARGYRG
jgi:hypothetical protein